MKFFRKNPETREKYDLVFSLGAACLCSSALRTAKLQFYSYPFDWLYGSTIEKRTELLCSEFQNWLKKDALIYLNDRDFPQPCRIYKNTKTDIVFNHDFSLNMDFEAAYSEVSSKYERRIDRLLKKINLSEKVLAVWICPLDFAISEQTDISLSLAAKTFENKYGREHVDILFIYHKAGISFENAKINTSIKGVKKVCFDYKNKDNTEEWTADNKKLVKWLASNYSTCDTRGVLEKVNYYLKKRTRRLSQYGRSLPEQIIYLIYYKIWKHFNKKLLKKGIIR